MSQAQIFEYSFRVSQHDIDRLGHVNNVVYLRHAQDAAIAHWNSSVTDELRDGLLWIVRRHEIDYWRPAFEDDKLVARTWIGAASGATLERFIEISRPADSALIASVRSVWVAVDPETRRPRRVTESLRALFELKENDTNEPC
jgi:acyl-CoA thioester hydrolase